MGGTTVGTSYAEEVIERYAGQRGMLLVALQEIQDHAGYIPREALGSIARAFGIQEGDVLGVISFYKELRTTPPGRHRLCVCRGDSCAAVGSHKIAEAVEEHLGVASGGTSADGELTYDTAHCLGNCALSPCVSLDGEVYGRATPGGVVRRLQEVNGD